MKTLIVLGKVYRTVDSCQTPEQCDVADKLITLAHKHMKTRTHWITLMRYRDELERRRQAVNVAMRRPFISQAF